MKTVWYYINDRFQLDDGTLKGCNIMFWGGNHEPTYWFAEYGTDTVDEAVDYLKEYTLDGEKIVLVRKTIKHPIPNRDYTEYGNESSTSSR